MGVLPPLVSKEVEGPARDRHSGEAHRVALQERRGRARAQLLAENREALFHTMQNYIK